MKKKFLTFIFAICLIIPAMFCLSGCVKDENPPLTYVVQFYNYDGTLIKEVSVEENSSATYEIPTKESTQYYVYEFSNWEFLDGTDATDALSSVSKTLTVRAKFNEVQPTYTINFYDEDGQLLETKEVLRGENSTFATNPTKSGDTLYTYEFDCWVDDNNVEIEDLNTVQSNMNLYAKYQISSQHTFVVKFYSEDGNTLLKEQNVPLGESVVYEITKNTSVDGYVYQLDYWANDEGVEVATNNVQQNLVLFPVFSRNILDVINNLKYEFQNSYPNHYEVSANGDIGSTLVIPAFVDSVAVKKVAAYSFENCTELESVTISEGITYIGNAAFRGCTALNNITIPESVTSTGNSVFQGCTNLTLVNIPSSITEIVSGTFQNCKNLITIELPQNLDTIGGSAFEGCEKLTNINLPSTINLIGFGAFRGSGLTQITIPQSVTSINMGCFKDCSKLETVNLSSQLITIDNEAFSGCSSLKEINLPSTLTGIGTSAFYNCGSIKTVTIPNGVKTMGSSVFERCLSLETAVLADSITSIGRRAFGQCVALSTITIPTNITKIPAEMFDGCRNLTTVNLHENVTEIGDLAFRCTNLTNIDLKNVVTIGVSAFELSSLEKVDLKNIKTIGERAFESTNLGEVVIGSSTTSIGDFAFWLIAELKYVYISSPVETMGENVFMGKLQGSSMEWTTIYCNFTTIPEGWVDWYGSGGCTLKLDYTYEQYLAEINGTTE